MLNSSSSFFLLGAPCDLDTATPPLKGRAWDENACLGAGSFKFS